MNRRARRKFALTPQRKKGQNAMDAEIEPKEIFMQGLIRLLGRFEPTNEKIVREFARAIQDPETPAKRLSKLAADYSIAIDVTSSLLDRYEALANEKLREEKEQKLVRMILEDRENGVAWPVVEGWLEKNGYELVNKQDPVGDAILIVRCQIQGETSFAEQNVKELAAT
jgi:hypothetical protein